MQRKNRIALVAHCILNQNSVIQGWARARGAFPKVLQILLQEGIGIVQLPCPEQSFGGSKRPPMTVEEYDTFDYRNHCRRLLDGVVDGLMEYQNHGVEVVGLIGIEESPSCCGRKGIFFEELQRQLGVAHLELPSIQIPPDHGEDEQRDDFLEKLHRWARGERIE